MAIIEAANVTRTYGKGSKGSSVFTAVAGVSLSVARGELVSVLGVNGAGKTSLVEVIEGIAPAASGTVRVLGRDPVRDRPLIRPRMGIMLQEAGFAQALTVAETLRMWAGTLTSPRPVTEVLELVDLTRRADIRVKSLSGGERRRLDLAMAILGRPHILFLDEPTTGLDPVSKAHLHDLILQRVDDDNATILMTTHDLAEAERIASRILIMSRGRIIADGSVTALREQLGHDAEVTWIQDGERHVHTTATPEHFLTRLDLGTITGLTITRPTLEETYLSLVGKEHEEQQS